MSDHVFEDKPMRVFEMIDALLKLPGDAYLYVSGYEGGVADAQEPVPVIVERNVHEEWYYGDHASVEEIDDAENPLLGWLIGGR